VVRIGLRALIEQSGRYAVVGDAGTPTRPCGSRRASSRRSWSLIWC